MATVSRGKTPSLSRKGARCPAVVHPDAVYRSDELKNRLGWRDAAWRSAIRQGLKVIKQGRWHYVHGSDVVSFLFREAD